MSTGRMRRSSTLEATRGKRSGTYGSDMPGERTSTPSTCPSCGSSLVDAPEPAPPAESVRVWMTEQDWSEPLLTRDVYSAYLVEHGSDAVDRDRFVRDLTRFGVREGTDGSGRRVLTCP